MNDNSISGPRVLTLDLETSPNLAHVWGLFNQNIGLNQLLDSGEVICFAAKWLGKSKVHFFSQFHHGKTPMVQAAHAMLDAADIVVSYNGKRFDMPHLNREFVVAGMPPPSPYAQVDLLQIARRQFRFPSNKLDHISQALDLGAKMSHTGHQLWIDCLAGKESAWKLMRQYNRHDVLLTERMYERLLPWISNHPHQGLYTGDLDCCPTCGGNNRQKRGFAYTGVSKFQQYRCNDCGSWYRGNRRLEGVTTTQVRK